MYKTLMSKTFPQESSEAFLNLQKSAICRTRKTSPACFNIVLWKVLRNKTWLFYLAEYEHSIQITDKLTAIIYTQKLDLTYNLADQLYTTHTKNRIWHEKNTKCQNSCDKQLKQGCQTRFSSRLLQAYLIWSGPNQWNHCITSCYK